MLGQIFEARFLNFYFSIGGLWNDKFGKLWFFFSGILELSSNPWIFRECICFNEQNIHWATATPLLLLLPLLYAACFDSFILFRSHLVPRRRMLRGDQFGSKNLKLTKMLIVYRVYVLEPCQAAWLVEDMINLIIPAWWKRNKGMFLSNVIQLENSNPFYINSHGFAILCDDVTYKTNKYRIFKFVP